MENAAVVKIQVRYLITNINKPSDIPSIILTEEIDQGYWELPGNDESFRIRIIDGRKSILTLKRGIGKTRTVFHQEIPFEFAKELLQGCHHRIQKTRYLTIDGWEYDFFHGKLEGVILAEFNVTNESDIIQFPMWTKDWKEVTSSLSNHHLARLNSELSDRGEVVDDILKHLRPFPTIAITGGPCSGKSTLIAELPILFPELTIMPETATIVISQVGIKPSSLRPQDFQKTIFRTQQIFEKSSAQMAIAKGSRALVVDRGTMDSAPYLPGGIPEFEQLMRTTKNHEFKKYGLVLFLDMPPREIYNELRSNNSARSETFDDAFPLSGRTKSAWQEHPNFVVVNGNSWEEKSANAINAITRFLETCP